MPSDQTRLKEFNKLLLERSQIASDYLNDQTEENWHRMIRRATHSEALHTDPIASDLLEQWINGNREHVVSILTTTPPHLTALLLLDLIVRQFPDADMGDFNRVANALLDHFVNMKD